MHSLGLLIKFSRCCIAVKKNQHDNKPTSMRHPQCAFSFIAMFSVVLFGEIIGWITKNKSLSIRNDCARRRKGRSRDKRACYWGCPTNTDPASTGHSPNAVSMLGQRRQQCANIETTLGECPNFCFRWQESVLYTSSSSWARSLVQVTIYRRLRIGRDGHLDQSEA